MYPKRCLTLLLLFSYLAVTAQIQITFPVNRIVLQRDNQNRATVAIAGNIFQTFDKIEARFVPVQSGQGIEVPWTTIQTNPSNGIFSGSVQVQGGWYHLEVRGSINGNIIAGSQVDRVGVGEVFVIAGQSNAEGNARYPGGANGANDDRVSTIDYFNAYLDENQLPFTFSQMGYGTKKAPYDSVPWFWAGLGDLLAQKLNVPVLFYGAAIGGIGSDLWQRSAAGEDLRSEYPLFIAVPGMPYRAMKASLQQYATRTGLRAILWQQGESDDMRTTSDYVSNLTYVINKIRTDSKKNDLAWVMARSSLNPWYHQNVIDAQNIIIQQVPNVFQGPNTDLINSPGDRYDGVHFMDTGLAKAASAWSEALDGNFFSNSNPLLPSKPLIVSVSCVQNFDNVFQVSAPNGYSSYNWSNGQTGVSTYLGTGDFFVKGSDYLGNTYFSPTLNISSQQAKLSVYANRSTNLCLGESVILSAGKDNNIQWSTGEGTGSIVVSKAGSYTVKNFSMYGCTYVSDPVQVNVNPLPSTKITASGPTTFCYSDSVSLIGSGNNVSYLWNTGASVSKITVNQSGVYRLQVKDVNGCISPADSVVITVKPVPANSVVADGPTTFCLGNSVNLSSSNPNAVSYFWSTGDNTKQLTAKTTGTYSLKIKDTFGCLSFLSSININTLPLPQTSIIAGGTTTFCDGGNVKLSASNTQNVSYLWSTGETTKDIVAKISGNFTLTVKDASGCNSPFATIPISVKAQPATPSIASKGTYFLEAVSSGTYTNPIADFYQWKRENTLLPDSSVDIKVTSSNYYSVRGYTIYTKPDNTKLTCYSNSSALYSFVLNPNETGLSLFPNPTSNGILFVETKENFPNLQFALYTLKGQIIRTGTINNLTQLQSVDLRDLSKGSYIIQIGSGDFVRSKRILLDY